jgi:hypothetical protein
VDHTDFSQVVIKTHSFRLYASYIVAQTELLQLQQRLGQSAADVGLHLQQAQQMQVYFLGSAIVRASAVRQIYYSAYVMYSAAP